MNLMNIITNLPIYPHWLETRRKNQGDEVIGKYFKGDVLEVGAGDGARKEVYLQKYKKIKKYTATDFSSWDDQFEAINQKVGRFGKLTEAFYGFKPRIKLDAVCSATDLPFKKESFDTHLSFEVLEHINDPFLFFSEATKVLRKGGVIALSVPYFYRMHGKDPDHKLDFFRYSHGFFYEIAERNNLKVELIYHNTGFGTTFAAMCNQFIIRKIAESNIIAKLLLFLVCPFIFLITNCIGYLIDLSPDKRFATRWHVILKKI